MDRNFGLELTVAQWFQTVQRGEERSGLFLNTSVISSNCSKYVVNFQDCIWAGSRGTVLAAEYHRVIDCKLKICKSSLYDIFLKVPRSHLEITYIVGLRELA